MKLKRLFPLVLILLSYACSTSTTHETVSTSPTEGKETKPTKSSKSYAQPIVEKRTLEQKDETCEGRNCARVCITYPYLSKFGKPNQTLDKEVRSILSIYIPRKKRIRKTEDFADMFIEQYRKFKQKFPDSKTAWYVNLNIKAYQPTKDILSFKIDSESYTGGVHSTKEIRFLNIHPTGQRLSKEELFTDIEAVRKLGEKAFRKQNGLKASDDLAAQGFLFENNRFALPKQIGFNKGGLVLYFNSYDIGSYSEGPIEWSVPLDQIKSYLRDLP